VAPVPLRRDVYTDRINELRPLLSSLFLKRQKEVKTVLIYPNFGNGSYPVKENCRLGSAHTNSRITGIPSAGTVPTGFFFFPTIDNASRLASQIDIIKRQLSRFSFFLSFVIEIEHFSLLARIIKQLQHFSFFGMKNKVDTFGTEN